MRKICKNKKGFTLIEIIVVLVILAILAAALIPSMIGFVNDARGKALIAEARTVYIAGQAILTEVTTTSGAAATNQDITYDMVNELVGPDIKTGTADGEGSIEFIITDGLLKKLVYKKKVSGITYKITIEPPNAARIDDGD